MQTLAENDENRTRVDGPAEKLECLPTHPDFNRALADDALLDVLKHAAARLGDGLLQSAPARARHASQCLYIHTLSRSAHASGPIHEIASAAMTMTTAISMKAADRSPIEDMPADVGDRLSVLRPLGLDVGRVKEQRAL